MLISPTIFLFEVKNKRLYSQKVIIYAIERIERKHT